MRRTLLKSKIHRARVTESNLLYEGSISIDPKLCEAANLVAYERVDVYNCNAGTRFSTYVIFGRDQEICLNGAAARLVQPGDVIIIASYAEFDESEIKGFQPKLVFVDDRNQIKTLKSSEQPGTLA